MQIELGEEQGFQSGECVCVQVVEVTVLWRAGDKVQVEEQ